MKKFSILSLSIFIIAISFCISCGYLISTALVATELFQPTALISQEKQTVYALSMQKSESEESLKNQILSLQSQTGAGYVLNHNDQFYLIASVYENANDAEKVKNNLKNNDIEAEIVSINISQNKFEGNFSNSEKTVLTNCLKAKFETFKSLYDVAISLDTNVFDRTQAKLECNNIYSAHISTKTNFETLFNEKTNDENLKSLKTELIEIEQHLSSLISEILDNPTQTFSSLIKLTYCRILFD